MKITLHKEGGSIWRDKETDDGKITSMNLTAFIGEEMWGMGGENYDPETERIQEAAEALGLSADEIRMRLDAGQEISW